VARSIALLVATIAISGDALACSCVGYNDISEEHVVAALCSADIVFVGEVEGTLQIRPQLIETKIWPSEFLKSSVPTPAFALYQDTCSFPFKPGLSYLVFAKFVEDTRYLSVHLCGLSGVAANRDFALQVLRESREHIDQLCAEDVQAKRLRTLWMRSDKLDDLERESKQLSDDSERSEQ